MILMLFIFTIVISSCSKEEITEQGRFVGLIKVTGQDPSTAITVYMIINPGIQEAICTINLFDGSKIGDPLKGGKVAYFLEP